MNDIARLKSLGSAIAILRKTNGMSQVDLALKAKVSKSFLSDLERGVRNPSYLTLCKIADALGVPVSAFFLG